MLPKAIELVHEPGCPICVLPMGCIVCLASSEGVCAARYRYAGARGERDVA